MTAPTISFRIEGHCDLAPSEVWPDGPPKEWTIADVVALCKRSGSVENLVSEWNLPALELFVTVVQPNGAYVGDDVLFGTPPEPFHTYTEKVWP